MQTSCTIQLRARSPGRCSNIFSIRLREIRIDVRKLALKVRLFIGGAERLRPIKTPCETPEPVPAALVRSPGCGWESLMKSVTLGNVTMSHRTRERPAECLASLSHSTMIGLPRAQH
ncbi:hypothetical protein EVAR_53569_1 [Eumeta japonica]|uniref:Uncharacterized protein n=1 Tax=Eumeta variegata TaxID=151549 RepID=A0A4C1YHG3_EUMVA|nr:hypothetical protein EVAR_53569_1 [Eumeta japonica]